MNLILEVKITVKIIAVQKALPTNLKVPRDQEYPCELRYGRSPSSTEPKGGGCRSKTIDMLRLVDHTETVMHLHILEIARFKCNMKHCSFCNDCKYDIKLQTTKYMLCTNASLVCETKDILYNYLLVSQIDCAGRNVNLLIYNYISQCTRATRNGANRRTELSNCSNWRHIVAALKYSRLWA